MRLNLLLLFLLFITRVNATLPDSVLTKLPGMPDSTKVVYLTDLCWTYSYSDQELSIEAGRQALAISERLGDSLLVAKSLNDLGAPYYRKGKYDITLKLWKRALAIRNTDGSPRDRAALQSKIAVVYQEQGKIEKALAGHFKAARIFEEIKDTAAMAHTYNNMANCYKSLGDYDKTSDYARLANGLFTRINHKYGMAISLGNMGMKLEIAGHLDSVIAYNAEALRLFRELGYKQEEATTLNNLGHYFRKLGEDAVAAGYFLEAGKAVKDINPASYAHYLVNYTSILTSTGKPNEAIPLLLDAIKISSEEEVLPVLAAAWEGLSNAYQVTGKYKQALEAKSNQLIIRDSILTAEKAKQIAQMQTLYETEKKERTIALLNKDTEIQLLKISEQELRLSEKNAQIYTLISAVFLLLVTAGSGYGWHRQRQRRLLDRRLLEEQKSRLKAVIDAQEAERSRISKDLHDGVGQLLAAARLNYGRINNGNPGITIPGLENLHHSNQILDEACTELRNISHQMMPRVLRESGLKEAIGDLLDKTFSKTGIRYDFLHRNMDGRLTAETETGVYRIAQELISNIMKHADATEVNVQLIRNNAGLVLLIEDNGKGIDPLKAGKGAGMHNIATRAETMGGNFHIEPAGETGTTATLRVSLTTSIKPTINIIAREEA